MKGRLLKAERLHVPGPNREIFIHQDAEQLLVIDAGPGLRGHRVVTVINANQQLAGLLPGLVHREDADLADGASPLELALPPLDDKGAGAAVPDRR